ncbi:MAG: class I tRNA ligase family protein, partial [Patescibacteria group bacterium]
MYNANKEEQEILKYWEEHKCFEKSVAGRPESKPYVFYDGPPFATGLPHYGHILSSVVKDVVPRYWTMEGYRVRRRWGWDCHGMPIENIVEKELKVSGKKDIEEKLGVAKFNDTCRSKVLTYTHEWK